MSDDVIITNPANEPFPEPEPTPEQIEEWERERAERAAALIAPSQAANRTRTESAEIIAEHDELLADMLYEMTLNEIGV